MPSAYDEKKDKTPVAQKDIASVVATLASRQSETGAGRKLSGPERAEVCAVRRRCRAQHSIGDYVLRCVTHSAAPVGPLSATARSASGSPARKKPV